MHADVRPHKLRGRAFFSQRELEMRVVFETVRADDLRLAKSASMYVRLAAHAPCWQARLRLFSPCAHHCGVCTLPKLVRKARLVALGHWANPVGTRVVP